VLRQPSCFGSELRRRRLAAGFTLTQLSGLVHYSKGQLSKVERGLKPPSRELARLCDTVLNANGELAVLVGAQPARRNAETVNDGDEEVWLMHLSPDGQSWFQPLSRRHVLATGAASMAGMHFGWTGYGSAIGDMSVLEVARSQFDEYRRLGQVAGADLLLPTLIAQTHMLRRQSAHTCADGGRRLLRLASRYAEYIGWLVQETGDDEAALWWTRQAVDFAVAGGDHDLAAYALARHALIALYQGDAARTITLAQQAQLLRAPSRVHGLAALHEAQGHALAGDHDACMRSLDRARALLAEHVPDPELPVIGTVHLPDPAAMVTGWCLYDLGRPARSAEIIEAELARVPARALRTRVRYGLRHALALAMAGEIDHACEVTGRLLEDARTVRSATVAVDLRALARTLSRHPRSPAVRDLSPELAAALHAVRPQEKGKRAG